MFITAFTSACHLSLSWARPIQSMTPHTDSWRSISALSSHLPGKEERVAAQLVVALHHKIRGRGFDSRRSPALLCIRTHPSPPVCTDFGYVSQLYCGVVVNHTVLSGKAAPTFRPASIFHTEYYVTAELLCQATKWRHICLNDNVSRMTCVRTVGRLVDNELESMWKEAVAVLCNMIIVL
jgi:hypothetical protein